MAKTFGELLTDARKRRKDPDPLQPFLRQKVVAQMLVIDVSTYRNWERDRALPQEVHRRKLFEIFPDILDKVMDSVKGQTVQT